MWPAALRLGLVGAALVAVMMFVLWLIHLRIKNAGVVDVGWSLGIAAIAVWYALAGPGYFARKWLFAAMVVIWGVRLAAHILARLGREPEDGRYAQLRTEWGGHLALKFFFFFEFQALLGVVLSLPALVAAFNMRKQLSPVEYAGTALWLLAVGGESLADAQLAAFKRDPANRGEVCQRGLWNYSRHPNYFFEWLVWVAWATFALASPHGWVALVCPALMLYFLFRVTGIPATEAQSLRSRGDRYRLYQRTTSAFVPWFKVAP